MQTFEESVKSISEDAKVFSEYGLLYYWLDVDKRPLNDKGYLEKCFSFLSKSIRSFGISVKKKNGNDSVSFDSAVTEELYTFIASKINVQNIQPQIKLQFDGSAEDIKNFALSVAAVLEYHKTLGDYIAEFLEEKYGNEQVYNIPRESVMTFASKLLHGCFPECFIPFDIELYGKSKRPFHDDECVVRDCVLPFEIKRTLFDINLCVYNNLDDELIAEANRPEKKRYLCFCTKVYALCRYLKENITGIEYNPITLAIMIFKSVVTMKWSGELTQKKRIFAYVEDNTGKGKSSVLCAVSEDGEHFFKSEIEGSTYDYRELISNTSYEDYTMLDIPAAKALAAFERFCKDECGFTTYEDEYGFTRHKNEIIFSEYTLPTANEEILFDFFRFYLDNADWVSTRSVETAYRNETTPLGSSISYNQFKEACNTGLTEPYATKCLYEEYVRCVHNKWYVEEELDQMEKYIKSHLDALYKDGDTYDCETIEAQICIALACERICLCDFKRFTALIDYIIDDYKRRNGKRKQYELWHLLSSISDAIHCDYRLPLETEEVYFLRYAIYRCISSENLLIVKEIIKKYTEINNQTSVQILKENNKK